MPRTMRQIFADVKRELALAMTDSAWEMYIQPLEPKSFEQGVLVLEATSPFAIEWCQVRLDKVIRRELQAHSGRPIETRYQVRKETENGSGKGDGVLPVRRVDDPARDQQARTEKSEGHGQATRQQAYMAREKQKRQVLAEVKREAVDQSLAGLDV